MMPPPDGSLSPSHQFVRNAQEIAPQMWLCEIQHTINGTGKVWHHAVLVPAKSNVMGLQYHTIASTTNLRGYRKGKIEVNIWNRLPPEISSISGVFTDMTAAVQFMIHNVKEFCK